MQRLRKVPQAAVDRVQAWEATLTALQRRSQEREAVKMVRVEAAGATAPQVAAAV